MSKINDNLFVSEDKKLKDYDDIIESIEEPTGENRKSIWIKHSNNIFDPTKEGIKNPSGTGISCSFENDILTISSTATNTSPYYGWFIYNVKLGDIIRLNCILLDSSCKVLLRTFNGTQWETKDTTRLSYIDGTSTSSTSYTVENRCSICRDIIL